MCILHRCHTYLLQLHLKAHPLLPHDAAMNMSLSTLSFLRPDEWAVANKLLDDFLLKS